MIAMILLLASIFALAAKFVPATIFVLAANLVLVAFFDPFYYAGSHECHDSQKRSSHLGFGQLLSSSSSSVKCLATFPHGLSRYP